MNSRIKGDTKLYGVIGDPISHTISPEIHNTVFDSLVLNSIYIPLRINVNDLKDNIKSLKSHFKGFNITIPHKREIMKYLDKIDGEASRYGAVNTVKVTDGRMVGYNTDGYGFSKSLEINKIDVLGKKILLLGAGGAARVAAYELIGKGAKLTISNRSPEKSKDLKGELESVFMDKGIRVETLDIREVENQYYGIVNATPVGMSPLIDISPVGEGLLDGVNFVFDLIYNPYKTKLLKLAESKGCKIINGFAMLFYQAIRAQEIWQDMKLEDKITIPILEEISEYLLKSYNS